MPAALEADKAPAAPVVSTKDESLSSLLPVLRLRDRALDCLRGVAIVWMTSTHVAPQSKLTAVLHLPSYVSAFEWFSFLSGVVLGMRAWHAHQSATVPRIMTAVRSRAFLLYRIHILMVLAVILIHETLGALDLPFVRELGGWVRTLALVFTLSLQPIDFMNILPLYIVLLLTAPLLIRMLNRGATTVLLSVSGALWLSSLFAPDLLPFPIVSFEPRTFSILSWQFIFILGLAAGYHREGALRDFWIAHKRKIMTAAVTIALTLFVFAMLQRRWALGLGLHMPAQLEWLLDKKTWGPLRAIYTIATLVIAIHATRLLLTWSEQTRSRLGSWTGNLLSGIEFMGRNSLACFVLHIGMALTAVALRLDERTQIVSEITLIVSLVLLYRCIRAERIVAWLPR